MYSVSGYGKGMLDRGVYAVDLLERVMLVIFTQPVITQSWSSMKIIAIWDAPLVIDITGGTYWLTA